MHVNKMIFTRQWRHWLHSNSHSASALPVYQFRSSVSDDECSVKYGYLVLVLYWCCAVFSYSCLIIVCSEHCDVSSLFTQFLHNAFMCWKCHLSHTATFASCQVMIFFRAIIIICRYLVSTSLYQQPSIVLTHSVNFISDKQAIKQQ